MVCFFPPTRPPYQQLHQSLIDSTAIAYLAGEGYSAAVIPRNCVLKPLDFNMDGALLIASDWDIGHSRHLCVNLDYAENPARLPCGLKFTKTDVSSGTNCPIISKSKIAG